MLLRLRLYTLHLQIKKKKSSRELCSTLEGIIIFLVQHIQFSQMPGTIQVSVFDFKNVSSSSICLWVSMGKQAYQTWDKGDFSFPLTTFRENLVVRLEDAEGNEISRKEVKTLSIVEKGDWDDFFQLEGCHYVHMKLQFILSEDERNLIRNVRESALKKKQDRVLVPNVKYKGTAVPLRDTFASSLLITREFSDRSEVNSSSPLKEAVEIQYLDVAAKKESISQKKNVVDSYSEPVDQGVLEKTPSSVRKMISAFETGLSQKGRRSLTRTRASKSQPNLVGIGGSLKDLGPDNTSRPYKMRALRLERPLNAIDLPEPQVNIRIKGENRSPEKDIVGTEQPLLHEELKQSSVHIVRFNEAGSSHQEILISARSQTISMAHPDMLKADNLSADRDCFSDPSVAEKRNREIISETLPEVHFERASNVKPKLIAYCDDELYDSENSGAWIFPDDKKRLCMTSSGKNLLHLSEDCHIGLDDHQRNKRPSMQETTGKRSFFNRSDAMTKKGREKPQKPRNQSESFGENGSSGPVRQVIKIALIVGFGILVLLTRQRETRRNVKKSKDFYFTSPDFMDQLSSSEEQWSVLTVDGD